MHILLQGRHRRRGAHCTVWSPHTRCKTVVALKPSGKSALLVLVLEIVYSGLSSTVDPTPHAGCTCPFSFLSTPWLRSLATALLRICRDHLACSGPCLKIDSVNIDFSPDTEKIAAKVTYPSHRLLTVLCVSPARLIQLVYRCNPRIDFA